MTMGKHFVLYIPCCIPKSNTKFSIYQTLFWLQDAHNTQHDKKDKLNTKYVWALMSFPKVLPTFCSDLDLKGCIFIFSHAQTSQTVLSVFYINFRFSSQLVFFFLHIFCFIYFSSGPHNNVCRPQMPKESNSRNESKSNHFVTKWMGTSWATQKWGIWKKTISPHMHLLHIISVFLLFLVFFSMFSFLCDLSNFFFFFHWGIVRVICPRAKSLLQNGRVQTQRLQNGECVRFRRHTFFVYFLLEYFLLESLLFEIFVQTYFHFFFLSLVISLVQIKINFTRPRENHYKMDRHSLHITWISTYFILFYLLKILSNISCHYFYPYFFYFFSSISRSFLWFSISYYFFLNSFLLLFVIILFF